ncbi:MAG: hypothetical protein SVU32_03170 [Candidatus Nanohaloarchaea archaeon]|nr:hypothetical protein [Candidatus Nanohaloarchaea archaeon]
MAGETYSSSFEVAGKEGSIRIERDPEPMFPQDSGTVEITIRYDEEEITVTSRDGGIPTLSISQDGWGHWIERVEPTGSLMERPIKDEKVDELEEAAEAVDDATGYAEIEFGPEVSPEGRDKIKEQVEYETKDSPHGSRVVTNVRDFDTFRQTVQNYDNRLEPVVDSDAVKQAWNRLMPEAYSTGSQ